MKIQEQNSLTPQFRNEKYTYDNKQSTVEDASRLNLIETRLERDMTEKKISNIVEELNNILPEHISLQFEFHDKSERYFVNVLDVNNEKLIRQLPAEKLLDTYGAIRETLGLLFDIKL